MEGRHRCTQRPPEGSWETKLKRSLKTDSLTLANALKWAVIAELKKELRRAAGGTTADPLFEEALAMREALVRDLSAGEPNDFTVLDAIRLRADEIAGEVIDEDPETGDPIYDPERQARAGYCAQIASGKATPVTMLLSQWHMQTVNRKERTKGDDVRALNYLEGWCRSQSIAPAVEVISRKVAGRFIADLPAIARSAGDGIRLSNKTANKYLSSLSAYWNWLKGRDVISENVWRGQFLPKENVDVDDLERPFTDDEIKKLLNGSPHMKALGPIIRIGALSGARIDVIVGLRVKDCEDGVFRFKPQERERGARYVPIHSQLITLIVELTSGRAPDDALFPEIPVPPPGSQIERSMPVVKAFGHYRKKVGVDERRPGKRRSLVNFHSFRRWFITMAERAEIPEGTISSVVGHKRQGMTFGVYSAGPGLEQLRACVEAVRLPA